MKTLKSWGLATRVASLVFLVLFLGVDWFLGESDVFLSSSVLYDILMSCSLLILSPLTQENGRRVFISAMLIPACVILFRVVDRMDFIHITDSEYCSRILIVVAISFMLGARLVYFLGDVSKVFSYLAPISFVEFLGREMMLIVLLLFVFLIDSQIPIALSIPILWSYYCLLYYYCYTGRFVAMSRKNERQMRENISRLRTISLENPGLDSELNLMFVKITQIMIAERPYLIDTFSQKNLATMACSNVSYVSRAINAYSGMNFRRFVNEYRVEYAVKLLKNNRKLKMSEIAEKSGFHNVVTFNMNFKAKMNCTPSEYRENLVTELLSNLPEPER